MYIYGLVKSTLLDYPGHLAATVFTGGCNFRCPFCHNRDLITLDRATPSLSEDDVLDFLKSRRTLLDGVCITGGEPTLISDLDTFLYKIKELGLMIKLDTNGYEPMRLYSLLQQDLLDAVAMDIKHVPDKYHIAAGLTHVQTEKIQESISIILHSKADKEFRTTAVRELHHIEDFSTMAAMLIGADKYFIQNFQNSEQVLTPGLHGFTENELQDIITSARIILPSTYLRGAFF
ncbi:MAG: anaerobic ribonucleoside-triphosphate reductase activating protein [Lachnospiraceae bacterium]